MKPNIFPWPYTIGSIILGIALGFIVYLFVFFTIAAILGSVAFLIILMIDSKSNWKTALRFFGVIAIALLTSSFTTQLIKTHYRQKADDAVKQIYKYKNTYHRFPKDIKALGISLKCNYQVDSSLSDFKIYYRGMYGFPTVFSSADSAWAF